MHYTQRDKVPYEICTNGQFVNVGLHQRLMYERRNAQQIHYMRDYKCSSDLEVLKNGPRNVLFNILKKLSL